MVALTTECQRLEQAGCAVRDGIWGAGMEERGPNPISEGQLQHRVSRAAAAGMPKLESMSSHQPWLIPDGLPRLHLPDTAQHALIPSPTPCALQNFPFPSFPASFWGGNSFPQHEHWSSQLTAAACKISDKILTSAQQKGWKVKHLLQDRG